MTVMLHRIWNNYWMLLLVGAYFALTSVYNEFGSFRSVFWNTYLKTVREGFTIILLYNYRNKLNNTLSIMACYGAIGISLSYMLFRFCCGLMANDYKEYVLFMTNTHIRLCCSIILATIFITIKLLHGKSNNIGIVKRICMIYYFIRTKLPNKNE